MSKYPVVPMPTPPGPVGPQPRVNAIIICDALITDRDTGKRSLIGVFTNIRARTFPAAHPQLSVYVRLIDAQGWYAVKLELVRVETMETIGEGTIQVEIPDRLRYHEIGFNLRGLSFPAPGQYEFRLYANDAYLTHQTFQVEQA